MKEYGLLFLPDSVIMEKKLQEIKMLITDCIRALFDLRRPAPQPADTVLRAAVFSDTHITGALYRRLILVPAMLRLRVFNPDLVIFAGDCTDNGNEKNWGGFTRTVLKHCRIRDKIVAIGNHDTWLSYDTPHEFAPAKENYLKNANLLMGTANKEVYFYCEENGVPFLILGTEGTGVGEAVTETQLTWLEATLQKTAASHPGKPVIVINHHPLNHTHGVGENEHGMGIEGDASEKLQTILDAYENVIYVCGHIHFGFQHGGPFATVQKVGAHIISVCLPCYEYGELFNGKYRSPGDPLIGAGLIMDIGRTEITLRGVNFMHGKEKKSFTTTLPLR